MSVESTLIPGKVERVIIVSQLESGRLNEWAFLEQLSLSMRLTTKDFKKNCQMLWIQSDPAKRTKNDLIEHALAKWPDLQRGAEHMTQFYSFARTPFGPALVLLIREAKSQTSHEQKYRYSNDLFPWNIQVSILIFLNDDNSRLGIRKLMELMKLKRLIGGLKLTMGFNEDKKRLIPVHKDDNITIGPVYVAFHDADELHNFMGIIESWAKENGSLSDMSKPSLCPSCQHYKSDAFYDCPICNQQVKKG